MSENEIKNKIEELKKMKSEVKGTPCTVWSRVVGYLRPVQGFNNGKIEEYKMRKLYNVADGEKANKDANTQHENLMRTMASISSFRSCCK